MPEDTHCCKRVFRSGGSFRGSPCLKSAKFDHNGSRYCSIHYPPHVEAKRKASTEKWQAEYLARRAVAQNSLDKQKELERRAACFDELLYKLKQYVELIPDRDAINLITKAEGRA